VTATSRPSGNEHTPRWNRLPLRIALQDVEAETEADLIAGRLKLRGVTDACNNDPPKDDRVIDDVREKRIFAGRREHARAQDGTRGLVRAGKREQVGEVGRRLADRPRAVYVIGHRSSPWLAQGQALHRDGWRAA
jgi:hypothetical protein